MYEEALQYIGHGRQNAVPLPVLARLMRMTERKTRHAVQTLNESGMVVIIREPKRGYYIPETAEEIDGYIRYNISYRKELNKKIRAMRKYRTENFGNDENDNTD